jgi:hypothetical protein
VKMLLFTNVDEVFVLFLSPSLLIFLDINYLGGWEPKDLSTLDVKDSSVKSPNTHANHLGLKPSYHESFMLS